MKTKHIIIIAHFLDRLKNEHQESEELAPLHSTLQALLTREELVAIIQFKFGEGIDEEYPDLKEKEKEALYSLIEDEYYILWWFLEEVIGEFDLA